MREPIDPTNDAAVFPAQGQGKGVAKNNNAWNMKILDRGVGRRARCNRRPLIVKSNYHSSVSISVEFNLWYLNLYYYVLASTAHYKRSGLSLFIGKHVFRIYFIVLKCVLLYIGKSSSL